MKKAHGLLLAVLALALIVPTALIAQWQQVSSMKGYLTTPGDNVWYVQQYNKTYKSTDAGSTWQLVLIISPFMGPSAAVQFRTESEGFVLDRSDRILYQTSDGGVDWINRALPTEISLISKMSDGFLCGDYYDAAHNSLNACIYKTNNRWQSSERVFEHLPSRRFNRSYMRGLTMLSELNGIAILTESCGDNADYDRSFLYETRDGGSSWHRAAALPGIFTPVFVNFVNETTGVIVGNRSINGLLNPFIYCTSNGGENWDMRYIANIDTGASFSEPGQTQILSNGDIYASIRLNTGGTLLMKSTDNGVQWTSEYVFPVQVYWINLSPHFMFISSLENAPGGGIYRKALVTSIKEGTVQPSNFQLKQNYPNPFNPQTTIAYTTRKAGLVTLSIYDMLGRLVAAPVNGIEEAGDHAITFDASSLASGHYIYQLKAGEYAESKKMTLIK